MPHYFASDVHLRNDRPDRDRRFRAWLNRLTRDDSLVIVGDLCDFWMGARRAHDDPLRSESLRALAEFRRQGGSLAIMAGNHDEWLCPFYEAELGATIIAEPHDMTVHGMRLRLVHGHLLGAGAPGRRGWRAARSSKRFLTSPDRSPGPSIKSWRGATSAGSRPTKSGTCASIDEYAAQFQGSADIVVFGHVHRPVDLAHTNPRLIVLGGWQRRSSFLKIDASGATFHVEHDCDQGQRAAAQRPAILNPPGRA